jgi:hypothetical protein
VRPPEGEYEIDPNLSPFPSLSGPLHKRGLFLCENPVAGYASKCGTFLRDVIKEPETGPYREKGKTGKRNGRRQPG